VIPVRDLRGRLRHDAPRRRRRIGWRCAHLIIGWREQRRLGAATGNGRRLADTAAEGSLK